MRSLPVPRVPLLGDPLRRVRVPKDLDSVVTIAAEDDPADGGMTRDGVEHIWCSVKSLFRVGVHPAISLCVRREGAVVLDRAIGWSRLGPDGDPPDDDVRFNTPETPLCIFSASKAITATVAHLLDQRGLLHIDDRVSECIPEYARNGKHNITIEHLLSHRAGVPNLPAEVLDLDNLGDRELLLRTMCDARPRTRPGKLLAYHAVSGGFIVEEIVRRVTGHGPPAALRVAGRDPRAARLPLDDLRRRA